MGGENWGEWIFIRDMLRWFMCLCVYVFYGFYCLVFSMQEYTSLREVNFRACGSVCFPALNISLLTLFYLFPRPFPSVGVRYPSSVPVNRSISPLRTFSQA